MNLNAFYKCIKQLHMKLDVKAYIYALLSTTKSGHIIYNEIYILYAYKDAHFFPGYLRVA